MTMLTKHQIKAFDDAENASAVGENDQDHVADNDFDDYAAAADYDDYSAAADYADYSADVEYVADQLHLGPGSEHLDSASHYCSKRL